jgi:hypothetical protein
MYLNQLKGKAIHSSILHIPPGDKSSANPVSFSMMIWIQKGFIHEFCGNYGPLCDMLAKETLSH